MNKSILKVSLILLITVFISGSCNTRKNTNIPPFDKNRAFGYLEHQVSLGFRVPGTKAHAETKNWLVERLSEHTDFVKVQPFRGNYAGSEIEMNNIIASFYRDMKTRVLLCAHWDSRHHADRDPDSTKWTEPVPGANDGASGVAVLLEIAHAITINPPSIGIDIVFFDGEDGGSYGDNSTWILGSRYFAGKMPPEYRPKFAILLDMIGDRNLSLSRDVNSMMSAPALWQRVTELCDTFSISLSIGEKNIIDDHIPLIERGIPSVDLIDFDYPSWHTVSDTPDKCSAESLEKIGKLVLTIIYEE